ncbi:MAG: hypothetical protein GXP40_08995 [Chloroflexi bacterium]|nr:hypothetical protein [Chloroflexota bacterium]
MRDWSLGFGDPLCLVLAADARLCTPDYANDHIWELTLGGGEPSALSLRTTYGLRARAMRIFLRFSEAGKTLTDPAAFAVAPRVQRFYANFLAIKFSPFKDVEVTAEYWVPDSHSVSGRLTIVNRTTAQRQIRLELCGLLLPLDGQNLAPVQTRAVHALAGSTGGLSPVLFLTGGPEPGPGPYPSLMLDLEMGPGARRQFTWAQAAHPDVQESFEAARHATARPWDAERARIELINESQTVDIRTGDEAWDAALAFSQQAALRLFFGGSDHLPQPSFVLARQPDHGYSPMGDGSDYPPVWSGQPPLEAYYLASLLPGAPELGRGLLRNFLAAQAEDGAVDCKPGLAGQRGSLISAPLLAMLAWHVYRTTGDDDFLAEVYPRLLAFFWAWLAPSRDRNHDSLPEWDHPLQTGFEDHPIFSGWHPWSRGVAITTVHSPALLAALYNEAQCLMQMAERLGRRGDISMLKIQADALRQGTQDCWEARYAIYRYADRDTHLTQRGKVLARQYGPGTIRLKQVFKKPVRLLVEVTTRGKTTRRPDVVISEYVTKLGDGETLERQDFQWRSGGAVATSQKVYTRIGNIAVRGIDAKDKVVIRTVDLTAEDQTLFLPLWAKIPERQQVQAMLGRTLLNAARFDRPFGIPACSTAPSKDAEAVCMSVHLPWNQLVAEGLLAYGFRSEAARLVVHLMAGVLQNLKQNHAFYQYYNAEVGTGIGERNALSGLAPVGLFLETLGVEIFSPTRVRLDGQNPFPWTVAVKYRGLSVTRYADRSEVVFPDGQQIVVTDNVPCTISL